MTPLTISEIWIYPIKSLGGIALQKARLQAKGLAHDRRWMLIDENGVAMTQRTFPRMALFKPEIRHDNISVTFTQDGKAIASVQFGRTAVQYGSRITATVWNDDVSVLEVDPEVSGWFSHHLNVPCRLVAFPEANPRRVDPRYSVHQEQVSLADAFPFLIIGQSSLDNLNERLEQPVPMNRFRPNFVFVGGAPFVEDTWRTLSIGTLPFVAAKKSERCVLTTVDQETAEKGSEPLRTLSTYRKVGNKVHFGQNLIGPAEGEVRVGDTVIPG